MKEMGEMMRVLLRCILITLIFIYEACAEDNTKLDGNILTIPTVELPNNAGQYRDVKLEFNERGAFELKKYYESIGFYDLDEVKLIKTTTFPVQVFLQFNTVNYGCRSQYIDQRVTGLQFELFFNIRSWEPSISDEPSEIYVPCHLVVRTTKIVPLPVYGLNAGIYTYKVYAREIDSNNVPEGSEIQIDDNQSVLTGTFELTEDNGLAAE